MRVLNCPTNVAGQMWEYAQGLRALGVESTVLTFSKHPFGYQDDICLHLDLEPSLFKRRWKLLKNFLHMIPGYDVIHFHFGGTLLPHHLDLPLLRLLRKKMVMSYLGSDVRLDSVAKVHNPYYSLIKDYHQNDDVIVQNLNKVSRYIKVAIAGDHELYEYVSPFFDRTVIIPQAIDTRSIQPLFPDPNNDFPLIVHAPSHKGIKGTQYVEQAISQLEKRHHFKFLLLHKMTNQEVKESLRKADIVVDQLLLGAHGIFSVEAMALGKPVLCYIRDDLVEKYPADLPIVNANPDTIESELEKLLVDPQLRAEIGGKSRRFAERYHDSRAIGQKLIKLYTSL